MDICHYRYRVVSVMSILKNILLALIILFTPIKAALITVSLLVILDLILGISISLKNGQPVTSRGMKATCIKLGVYELCICLSFLVETFLSGSLVPVSKIATTIIGLTELKSVMENLDLLAGGSLLKSLINAVQAQASAQEQPETLIETISPPEEDPEPPKAA